MFSTVSTSYGPVVIQSSVRPGTKRDSVKILLGLGLALLSAVLFAANHFLFQFRGMNTTDMMLTRGVLQALCAPARACLMKVKKYACSHQTCSRTNSCKVNKGAEIHLSLLYF